MTKTFWNATFFSHSKFIETLYFLDPKFFWTFNFSGSKVFGTHVLFIFQSFHGHKFFGAQIFRDPNFFETQNCFRTQIFLDPQFLWTTIFWNQDLSGSKILLFSNKNHSNKKLQYMNMNARSRLPIEGWLLPC